MLIKSATFLKSVTNIKDCPKSIAHDFAFIGRSNVGKSSLINMLVNRKQLAKTSGKPGKTQTINFFLINDKWHLVDLPGYGWAGVSKEKKIEWVAFVRDYLLKRENLFCLFILIDIRHEPQSIDLEFINWAGENYKKRLLRDWESLPDIFSTSALKHQGKEEILNFIDKINSA
jgi:GTP-binding protein